MASILAISAVPVAHFFGEQRLTKIVYVAALGSAVGAFENIGIVDFRRFIAFDKEFKLNVVPRLVSVIVAIVLAAIISQFLGVDRRDLNLAGFNDCHGVFSAPISTEILLNRMA